MTCHSLKNSYSRHQILKVWQTDKSLVLCTKIWASPWNNLANQINFTWLILFQGKNLKKVLQKFAKKWWIKLSIQIWQRNKFSSVNLPLKKRSLIFIKSSSMPVLRSIWARRIFKQCSTWKSYRLMTNLPMNSGSSISLLSITLTSWDYSRTQILWQSLQHRKRKCKSTWKLSKPRPNRWSNKWKSWRLQRPKP